MFDTQFFLLVSEWLGIIALAWLIQLSGRFNFRPIGFVYARREGIISLSLYSALLLTSVVLTTPQISAGIKSPLAEVPQNLWLRLILSALAALIFGLTMLVRRQPLRSIGWDPKRFGFSWRLALPIILLTVFLRSKVDSLINGLTSSEINLLLVWLVIALVEETVFRGFIQLRLNYWMGNPTGWLATALLYVLWSLPFYLATPELLVYKVLVTVIQALVLGWLMQKSTQILPVAVYRLLTEWLFYTV
ncbi:MAG: CPBP family intramembrane metalloprotease [Anaerolineae bacterium]|nr:CPBP family intramembrane metalloprotease [Anaerolineae bacterium]